MIDEIEGIMDFQKLFMEVMSEIRSHNMFTFPVNSISLLKKDDKFVDEEFAKWACAHNMQWNDSNIFIDDSVSSLSNCCFDGRQKVLTKSSDGVNYMAFKELFDAPYKATKRNFTIFHNGSWVQGKAVKAQSPTLYKVETVNGKTIGVTPDHINVTQRGDIPTSELTTDDYLMFSARVLNAVNEVNNHYTYEQGFFIGMYAGDGSMGNEDNTYTTIVDLSLNKEKYEASKEIIDKVVTELGGKWTLGTEYNNVYPVRISGDKVGQFVRMFISGKYSFEKSINLDCLLQNDEFRKGILDGYYLTDGGNSNRIYTVSPQMAEDLEVIVTSLGMQTIIDVSDRRDEPVIVRGETYKRNYPLYCVRWYTPCNKRKMTDLFMVKNNAVYFKIKSIEQYDNPDPDNNVYCFEIYNDTEPYFTLPNGIITHNCRLKSNIEDLGFYNSIGGTALKVGSIKVSTINLARLALENKTEDAYLNALAGMVELDLKILDRQRHTIRRNVEKGLLPNFADGLVDFEHCYSTIGFIGIYETLKTFGYTVRDEFGNTFYTEKADDFGRRIFETIHSIKDKFVADKDYMVNTEQIPGESAAVKLMKKDMYFFPDTAVTDLPLYGNQFIPLGIQTTMKERIRIAALFDKYCNGGSICHINHEAPIRNFDQAWKLLNYIKDTGLTYFAFNTKIQACKHNHAFFGKICPVCGEPVATEYTRIVGFYTPVRTYSKERKAEYGMRRWEDVNKPDPIN